MTTIRTTRPSPALLAASSATGKMRPLAAAAVFLLLLPLGLTSPAFALYPPDGTKPDGSGGHMIPGDGMCVVGVKQDGTMQVDWDIKNARDCVAYTRSADGTIDLKNMTTQAQCQTANGTAPNDGYRHGWSTSICYDTANSRGISRVDLDNTAAMCTSKGGTVVTTGKCIAYGWIYRNRKADNTLPISGTGIGTTDGVQLSDGLGFCYASMRMTSATYNANTFNSCPSFHNSRATSSLSEWPDCLSSTTGCQTQASYDAGLGWSWDATNSRCLYAYGVKGILNADATKADGSKFLAGSTQDLTVYTNQGDCLANGFSWDNWLPNLSTTVEDNTGDYTGMPAGSLIRRLDALSSVEDGGGAFYSGTGAVCEKCHSDQSRSYAERDKPGYPRTPHRLAGDTPGEPFQPFFTAANSAWGLDGVQCAMCHSTAKPAQDDLIQVVPAGVVGPPAAGAPKSASGHNQTEYGTHLIDICYTCHGVAANPVTTNPASVIPASGGDLALTPKGLPPIANMFLNSPHAKYTGSSTKVDVGNKSFYTSSFLGYICRSSNSIGGGSILTTVYRNGVAQKIPFVQGLTNPACTNPGDGSATSGAAGFWVPEGETSPGIPADTSQGNCMTCHDVHWAFGDPDPEAEPLRRECTTCHTKDLGVMKHPHGGGTPFDVAEPAEACVTCHMPNAEHLFRINTSAAYSTASVGGTQLNTSPDGAYANASWVDLDGACGQCHGGGTKQASTTGTTSVNSAVVSVGSTTNFVVGQRVIVAGAGVLGEDLQSHVVTVGPGTSLTLGTAAGTAVAGASVTQNPTANNAPYLTKAQLAPLAEGIHNDGPAAMFGYTFGSPNTLTVNVNASASVCPDTCDSYAWDWGDGSPLGSGVTASHTYATAGTRPIKLTVTDGATEGSITKSVTTKAADLPPTIGGTCTTNADTWVTTVTDTSTDDVGIKQVTVNWGDGSALANDTTAPFGPFTHKWFYAGSFTLKHKVVDSIGQTNFVLCQASVSTKAISGNVTDGAAPLPSVLIQAVKSGAIVKATYTNSSGSYSLTGLKPGTYNLVATKYGYTFALPAATVSVGPNQVANFTGTPVP